MTEQRTVAKGLLGHGTTDPENSLVLRGIKVRNCHLCAPLIDIDSIRAPNSRAFSLVKFTKDVCLMVCLSIHIYLLSLENNDYVCNTK